MRLMSESDIVLAVSYLQNRSSSVNGVHMPESMRAYFARIGVQPNERNFEYLIDSASVRLYPHEENYLQKKWDAGYYRAIVDDNM